MLDASPANRVSEVERLSRVVGSILGLLVLGCENGRLRWPARRDYLGAEWLASYSRDSLA